MKRRNENQRSPRWAVWRWFYIPDGHDPTVTYLRRLRLVQTPWFGLYVHWIYLPDRDRDPHDHPWPFASLILRGGYIEHVWADPSELGDGPREFRHRRFSFHRVPVCVAHMIVEILPGTVTLIVVGRRVRQWGFWTPAGFMSWTDYDRVGLGPDPFDS